MTGAFVTRISAGLAAAFVLAACTTAGAQTPDPRWNDWLGCWNLVADGNVARLPPAEDAAGGVTGPVRPDGNRDARVCVAPSQRGAELRTFVGEQQVLSQTIRTLCVQRMSPPRRLEMLKGALLESWSMQVQPSLQARS